MRGCSSASMPGPKSRTVISIRAPTSAAASSICLPSAAYLMALSIRLSTASVSALPSIRAGSSAGSVATAVIPALCRR